MKIFISKYNYQKYAMRVRMHRQFTTYYIRCRVCGKGKSRSEYEGNWRVCSECRKKLEKKI